MFSFLTAWVVIRQMAQVFGIGLAPPVSLQLVLFAPVPTHNNQLILPSGIKVMSIDFWFEKLRILI
jgi:hypothetical protein